MHAVLAERGVKLSVEDLKRGYEESAFKFQGVWNRNDEVPIVDQIQTIVELAAGYAITFDSSWMQPLEKAYIDPVLSIPPKLNPEGPAILQAVRNRGYKIGLISNTGRSPGSALRQLLEAYGIRKYFDATVFSNEVMRRKPDRLIFDHTAQLLGAPNELVVHVGDNPESDFWGARNAGMQAILLDQSLAGDHQWPANSLFSLTRANMRQDMPMIDSRWRIESLSETLGVVDSVFRGAN